jgi:signal transduction histidine kinase
VPLDADVEQLVLAAREAMTNAAKFAGAGEISVYAESDASNVSVFIRDRGAGFDRATIPPDRHGLSESIEGRLARVDGQATIRSTPGEGTEIELTMPRGS